MTLHELLNATPKKNTVQILVNGKDLEEYNSELPSYKDEDNGEPAECMVCSMRNNKRCGNCPVR